MTDDGRQTTEDGGRGTDVAMPVHDPSSVLRPPSSLFLYTLRLADNALILGHRLSEWCGHAPVLEEDLALANMALDLIGQARALYQYAGAIEGRGRDEDALAYRRDVSEFRNVLLDERTNGEFAVTIHRQLVYAAFAHPQCDALARSQDEMLAG